MLNQAMKDAIQEQNFIRVFIPITNCKELGATEKLMISHILSYEMSNMICYYSTSNWADILACGASTITRTIKKLKENGWITYESGNQTSANKYHSAEKVHNLFL